MLNKKNILKSLEVVGFILEVFSFCLAGYYFEIEKFVSYSLFLVGLIIALAVGGIIKYGSS